MRGTEPFTAADFKKKSEEDDEEEFDVLILDTRHPISYSEAHIPGSIYVGIKAGP